MSIEKLLIFGLALALVTAVTLSATAVTESRVEGRDTWRGKVEDLSELAR